MACPLQDSRQHCLHRRKSNIRYVSFISPSDTQEIDEMNSGNYKFITPFASNDLISDIKARRSSSFQSVRLSWKLHREIEQEIVCVRQQEVSKIGEFVAQVAVRFVTDQVRSLLSAIIIKRNGTDD